MHAVKKKLFIALHVYIVKCYQAEKVVNVIQPFIQVIKEIATNKILTGIHEEKNDNRGLLLSYEYLYE